MVNAPSIISRNEWGANNSKNNPSRMTTYNFLVLHHAAGNFAINKNDAIAEVREIQNLHQDKRGWSDIGYHFLIDAAGNIFQGRPFKDDKPLSERPDLAIGAHVANQNSDKIGVCMLGCYHPEETEIPCDDNLTDDAYNSLIDLFAFLSSSYGISNENIKGHRDFKPTACPGSKLYSRLTSIREDVIARVQT